tara:strand:- start:5984 stop:6247 length:264 start_codon:yes stop_codon:yes gene_type:complete
MLHLSSIMNFYMPLGIAHIIGTFVQWNHYGRMSMLQNKVLISQIRCDFSVHHGSGFAQNVLWNTRVSAKVGGNINAESADVFSLTAP